MPGFRLTRSRLPMLAIGAVAILILAACGDEAATANANRSGGGDGGA